jgi:hypothetical protein
MLPSQWAKPCPKPGVLVCLRTPSGRQRGLVGLPALPQCHEQNVGHQSDGSNQLVAHSLEILLAQPAGFFDYGQRACRNRIERNVHIGFVHAVRDHDDGRGRRPHDLARRLQSIQAGHNVIFHRVTSYGPS